MNHTVRVRSRAGDHCVRLRPDRFGESSQLFAAERWALPLAARAGLGHATLLGTLYIEDDGGWSAAVFETVDAPRLDGVLDRADARHMAALGRAWGRDLAALHGLPCKGFGTLLKTQGHDPRHFLRDLFLAEQEPLEAVDPALSQAFVAKVRIPG